MRGEEKQAAKAVEKIGASLEETAGKKVEEALSQVPKGSLSLHQFLNMDDVKIENVYAQAYRLYNNGKYRDSAQIFRYLIVLCPGEIRYMLGLAACCHLLKAYKPAVEVYMLCNVLDPNSPIADYHASDCYLQMQDKISALISLKTAIKKAGLRAEYQVLKERATLTAETLRKELHLAEDEDVAAEKQASKK